MKNNAFNPLSIVKAQFSNEGAEECASMKTGVMVFLIIAVIFITSFPYVNNRVRVGITDSDASKYPGFGAVLIDCAKKNDFQIQGNKLVLSNNEQLISFESNGWLVMMGDFDVEKELNSSSKFETKSKFLMGIDSVAISSSQTGTKISSSYKSVPTFSSKDIKLASKNVDSMVTYVRAFLFSVSIAEIPGAILTMIILLAFQIMFYQIVMALLLSYTKKKTPDPEKQDCSEYGFVSSLKIMSSLAILPSLVIAGVSYYKPSFGLSLGFVLYALVLGTRTVILYITRIKGKNRYLKDVL